jgi:hypothetical protein
MYLMQDCNIIAFGSLRTAALHYPKQNVIFSNRHRALRFPSNHDKHVNYNTKTILINV